MTDLTQGADAPDDASLFSDATTTTLEKFENPELPKEAPKEPDPKEPVKEPGKEPAKADPEAPVPAGRLREESDARRRAERERDDLMRQLTMRQQPPPPPPPPRPDMFENPSGFVQGEVKPFFDRMQQELQMQREAFSEQMAGQRHGFEKVGAAKQALEQGMTRGDPDAKAAWDRAMQSAHPYDVITRWHLNNEAMREMGGDIGSYKQRVLEEAMKDPDFQRKVIEASKGGAQHVARPVTSAVPKIPSLGNVGAGSGEADLQEPSDEQLFRAVTTARRK